MFEYLVLALILAVVVGMMDPATRARKKENLLAAIKGAQETIHNATAPTTNNADAEVASHEDPRTTDRRGPQDGVGQHQGEVSETFTRNGPALPMGAQDYRYDPSQPRRQP
jgi:type II secretory pathway pseudopilin PulG